MSSSFTAVDRLVQAARLGRIQAMRGLAAALNNWSGACLRLADAGLAGRAAARRDAARTKKHSKSKVGWQGLLTQYGRPEVLGRLLTTGLIGDDLPRSVGLPRGRRILVLAAHQDDEMIGAGGTFVACAQAGCTFEVIYYTDGCTFLAGMDPVQVSRWRHDEASRVWRELAGVKPTFWDYPNRASELAADAGARLVAAIERFAPDVIFLPVFFEQPTEHRRLTDALLAAHAQRPIGTNVEVWGYQITTRIPGNCAVDITPFWKRKYKLNRRWRTQNVYMDYAHLAKGRDVANSYYLKGRGVPRHAAAYAEVFLAFPAQDYIELARLIIEPPLKAATAPPPDFLIVGMQKSGSYWLTALLDQHPEIRCFPSRPGHGDGTGEAHLFDVLARLDGDFERFRKSMRSKLGGFFAPDLPLAPPTSTEARQVLTLRLRDRFNEFCHMQRIAASKRFVGEKTTETVHHPELVEALYPGIRKVCILRDPRDRLVSFFFHQRRKGQSGESGITTAHVDAYAERVRKDYRGLLNMTEPLHVLTYERLSQDPAGEATRLLEFLGADARVGMVQSLVTGASFTTLSGRAHGESDESSHFREGRVGGWDSHLAPDLADRLMTQIRDVTEQIERRFALDLKAQDAHD